MIKYHLLIDERSTISLFTNKLKDASTIRFFGLSKNYSEATNNLPNIYLSDIVVVSENLGIQFLDNFSHLFVTNSTTSSHACKVVKLVLTKDEVNEVNASLYKEMGYDDCISLKENDKDLIKHLNTLVYQKLCSLYNHSLKKSLDDGIEIPGFNEIMVDILHDFGIPASLTGYQYLKRAIEMAFLNIDTVVGGVTKVIYPTIAQMYNTTSPRVERSMRHAIETGWCRAKIETMEKIFSYSYSNEKGKPTNGEFIANISDYLIIHFRKERKEYLSAHPDNVENVNHIINISNAVSIGNNKEKEPVI